jgi:TetR/AcrR family transcriptional regulator, transcriptional repressor for nem operon
VAPDVRHFDPDDVLERVEQVFWRQGLTPTGIQALVDASGLNRSSLYATFGSKTGLYTAALRRYLDQRSRPMFEQLATGHDGLADIERFFARLIAVRSKGRFAQWGCMVSNAHADGDDPDVRAVLAEHHTQLRSALAAALSRAAVLGHVRPDLPIDETAETLALLAHGVNVRSRIGEDPQTLTAAVSTLIGLLTRVP